MELSELERALQLDREAGRLYWRNPPRNHAEKRGQEAGCIYRGKGKNKDYWYIRVLGRTVKRSRLVFFMVYGWWPTPCVDHIDGDSLNDRPDNLREATYIENAQAAKPYKKASSLPRGVFESRGRFGARITVNRASRFLGYYDTPEAAGQAHQAAREAFFRDYA